ncbi:MAG TPA: ATP-binding cassette domain-containing protein [Mycobacteriales bacterium]|nr:ATP-binding cassette domain-containing protein [Mycobacteriales bacterium]
MIEAQGLTKRYGDTVAVDNLSFTVQPGVVTGFLGPNGAGKSTTMRLILGLDTATSGAVTVNGTPYPKHRRPLTEVGALLEARSVHGGRSAYNHLLCIAQTNGIPAKRVNEVLELVGLAEVAKRRSGAFSLGMGQRLGIASALLGDPKVLLLDEPVNGLDPEGMFWVRNLLKHFAATGKTVFVSSHLMSEMALTADRLIVIGRGRLIADATTEELIRASAETHVRARSPQADALAAAVAATGATVEREADGALSINGATIEAVGELAANKRIVLHELSVSRATLEAAFMELTEDAVDYHATSGAEPDIAPPWGASA